MPDDAPTTLRDEIAGLLHDTPQVGATPIRQCLLVADEIIALMQSNAREALTVLFGADNVREGWHKKPNGLNYPIVLGAEPMFPHQWDKVLVISRPTPTGDADA